MLYYRLKSGALLLNSLFFNWKLRHSPLCRVCVSTDETIQHVFFDCQGLSEETISLNHFCSLAKIPNTDTAILKSWFNVINSSKCGPITVSAIKISDFVAHFTHVSSTFNQSIQSMSLLHNTIPQVLQQAHILSISGDYIYRALKRLKKSSAPNRDGLSYNHFVIKCT